MTGAMPAPSAIPRTVTRGPQGPTTLAPVCVEGGPVSGPR
jgi:hypothetical protein